MSTVRCRAEGERSGREPDNICIIAQARYGERQQYVGEFTIFVKKLPAMQMEMFTFQDFKQSIFALPNICRSYVGQCDILMISEEELRGKGKGRCRNCMRS